MRALHRCRGSSSAIADGGRLHAAEVVVPSRQRRLLEAALAVFIWTALGWLLDADANLYLLIGVPITIAFQWWVARRPLHTLWVRDAPQFDIDARGFALAAGFALVPAYRLVEGIIGG